MPNYTIYKGDRHTGNTETCTGTGAGMIFGPPFGLRAGTVARPYRGCYIKQDATTYRWIYDEPCATIPTTWDVSHSLGT